MTHLLPFTSHYNKLPRHLGLSKYSLYPCHVIPEYLVERKNENDSGSLGKSLVFSLDFQGFGECCIRGHCPEYLLWSAGSLRRHSCSNYLVPLANTLWNIFSLLSRKLAWRVRIPLYLGFQKFQRNGCCTFITELGVQGLYKNKRYCVHRNYKPNVSRIHGK